MIRSLLVTDVYFVYLLTHKRSDTQYFVCYHSYNRGKGLGFHILKNEFSFIFATVRFDLFFSNSA